FLYTASSRGRLCCSLELLTHVLARHRVMPSFLDFVFEFRNTESPLTTAMFRFEDRIETSSQIQHAFSIMAPEKERPDSSSWLIRRVAAYHSFDTTKGKSVWIIVKGNKVIRDRIGSSSPTVSKKTQKQRQSEFALSTHLLILEWCTENWALYLDDLEDRGRKHAAAIKLAPVETLARKPPLPTAAPLRSPPPRRSSAGVGPQPIGIRGKIRSNLSRISSGFSGHYHQQGGAGIELSERASDLDHDEERLDKIFKFDDLQRMRHVTDEAERASLILDENRRIVSTLKERYSRFAGNNIASSGSSVLDFCQQLAVLEGDLESHAARVHLLLRSMERNEEMFQGILHYGNMRVGEHYAQSAEVSARTMEEWTERMHDIAAETEHETVSMHGITVLTMIFLPGTFVSTLFSSGIWNFDNSKSRSMGDWETRVPALMLFFSICIPLMVAVLLTWWVTYHLARRQHKCCGCFASGRPEALTVKREGAPRLPAPARALLQNPQPVFGFTDHVEELKQKYSGRDGAGNRRPYIPENELKRYWTKSRVHDVCKSHAPHLTIKWEVVNQRCLRLFSILVYLDRAQYFEPLLERGISDAKLPLTDSDVPQALRTPAFEDVLDSLLKHQWTFCPLVLDYALLTNLHLHSSHILPFREEQQLADGDAAHIHRILVSGECNKLDEVDDGDDTPEDRIYVLKTYTESRYRHLYTNEARALTTLQQPKNENIVGYYGSFVQNGTFNLLLQFADGGNLLDYYGNTPPPTDPLDVRRFWTSLFSVFKGLHAVHRIAPSSGDESEYRGIHQDIKPDNIILTKGPSGSPYDFCPLLADFGHSHIRVTKPEDGEEESEMGIDRQGNQTYECSRYAKYLVNLPGRIPTAADIFSVGCVISDAASWLAFGAKGRDMYRDLRAKAGKAVVNFEDPSFYDCFHDALNRSAAVDDMHERIRADCETKGDDLTPNILDLVQNHMLLWDWHQRLEARQLWELFVKMSGTLEEDRLQVEQPEGLSQTPSRRDQMMAKAKGISTGISSGINRVTRSVPTPFQSLPSPPSSDPPESVASPGAGGDAASSASINDRDAQLLQIPTPDEHPPPSPKLPSRPALDAGPAPNASSNAEPSEAYQTLAEPLKKVPGGPDTHQLIRSLHSTLSGRDHLFIVDTSRTMRQHKPEVEHVFTALSYLVKRTDLNKSAGGISLIVGPREDGAPIVYRDNKTTKLLTELQKCRYDRIEGLMEDELANLVQKEIIPKLPLSSSPQSGEGAASNPLSVIVFTNGQWGTGSVGAGMQHPIQTLIETVKERKLKRTQLMVQFLRFGDDPDGARHLRYLVSFAQERECDIIDTRSTNGNVCDMLIGSLNNGRAHDV
ncbi:hypothetical protein B0T14DRAFT_426565, partial [Immersiella caudata]